jgi:hypothetical protein
MDVGIHGGDWRFQPLEFPETRIFQPLEVELGRAIQVVPSKPRFS